MLIKTSRGFCISINNVQISAIWNYYDWFCMSALSGVFFHGLTQGLGLRKWKENCHSWFLFGTLMIFMSDLSFGYVQSLRLALWWSESKVKALNCAVMVFIWLFVPPHPPSCLLGSCQIHLPQFSIAHTETYLFMVSLFLSSLAKSRWQQKRCCAFQPFQSFPRDHIWSRSISALPLSASAACILLIVHLIMLCSWWEHAVRSHVNFKYTPPNPALYKEDN